MLYLTLVLLGVFMFNVVKGDRWFSATVTESDQSRRTYAQEYMTNLQDTEDRFIPVIALTQNHGLKTPTINTNKTDVIVIKLNNTIHNDNLIKKRKLRPKRKVIRRCTLIRPRENKVFKGNRSKNRFLEIFQVVEFEHTVCKSSSGLDGTCLHNYECQASGGTSMGSCADGYGICCIKQLTCEERTSASIGWFTNPGFPSPSTERLSCAVTLDKASEDIKQIRLDFASFELLPPSSGLCDKDQFVVSGQNVNNVIPILCGINTGQHVYIEVGDIEGPLYISIQTESAENRLFSIRFTQLTWADELAAPTGCLQYFKETGGHIESFNYRDSSEIGMPRYPSYLNNFNYAMCIERALESCSVTFSNAGSMQILNYDAGTPTCDQIRPNVILAVRLLSRQGQHFSRQLVDLFYFNDSHQWLDGLPVIPPNQAGVEIFNCPSDWLLISATRLCGERLNDGSVLQDFALNAPITDYNAGPITVWFRSDEFYVGRGFRLKYKQNPCSRQN